MAKFKQKLPKKRLFEFYDPLLNIKLKLTKKEFVKGKTRAVKGWKNIIKQI